MKTAAPDLRHRAEAIDDVPTGYCECGKTWPHHAPRTEAPDVFDRLMELWQQPWSEAAYGEAQMLLARLRESAR